jgi:hypothetical protein
MTSLSTPRTGFKSDFSVIADSFLHTPGLPFASVLDGESIQQVFREEEALFGQEDIFSTQMVRRELWVTLLAYNLIRKVIATSAAVHRKQPRHLGFTLACQSLLASWMLLSTGILQ